MDSEELALVAAELRRVERSVRLLRQLVARLVESEAAQPSTAEEAHENGSIRTSND